MNHPTKFERPSHTGETSMQHALNAGVERFEVVKNANSDFAPDDLIAQLDKAIADACHSSSPVRNVGDIAAHPILAEDPSSAPSRPSPDSLIVRLMRQRSEQIARQRAAYERIHPPVVRPKSWRDLDRDQKLLLATRAAEVQRGLAFTVKLSHDTERRALASGNPARFLSNRIATEMRRNPRLKGIPFGFALEFSGPRTHAGYHARLHLHGVIIPRRADQNELRIALRRAGGDMHMPHEARGTQVNLREFDPTRGADGWFRYLIKDRAVTRQYLPDCHLSYISNSIRDEIKLGFKSDPD